MTHLTCPDCNCVRQSRPPKNHKNFFDLIVGINGPQNGLSRNGRVNLKVKTFSCELCVCKTDIRKNGFKLPFFTTKGYLAGN